MSLLRAVCFWVGAVELTALALLIGSLASARVWMTWCARKMMARGVGAVAAPRAEGTSRPTSPAPAPSLHIEAATDTDAVDKLLASLTGERT